MRLINGSWNFRYAPKTFRNGTSKCSCGPSSSCQKPQGFYCQTLACRPFNALPNRTIPGMFLGCFPIDSILLSTLECLYDQSCVQMLIDWRLFDFSDILLPVNLTNITALDRLAPSRFLPNTSLEIIISQLLIENWTTSVNFRDYFAHCQLDLCRYTVVRQHQPIFVITNVIGLVGGIIVILRLLVPHVVKTAQHVSDNCQKRPSTNTGQ
ncbi:unnamed protein product [Rotaria sp. Silwood2]|nr:unnamed protein product [Rotaria sp. Silwood2]CAF3022712.1 unnamed protein product [Rotaria sp. Silwood2]CAF3151353.1 unnamed protein product [Rotaria sp. Silwood2]CAF4040782.1 unnamed protein product [Rotaria sp. Silwood2]CAF4079558.1 unnamed protein product [Rotaria sp. Silwood2]